MTIYKKMKKRENIVIIISKKEKNFLKIDIYKKKYMKLILQLKD